MDAPLLRRPNGRPQACEVCINSTPLLRDHPFLTSVQPCRKRKVACDHTQPTCRRCIKRRQESECVYIVQSDRQSAPSAPRGSPAPALSPRPTAEQTPPPEYTLAPDSHQGEILTPVPPSNGYNGYLGFTSYSSVFEETESALGITAGTTTTSLEGDGMSTARTLSPQVFSACLKILSFVPDPKKGIENFRQIPTTFDGFPHAIAQRIVRSLYETFGRYLGRNRNPRDLESLARRLCANSSRPFSEQEPDADRWIDQFIGENLRWESLGVLFTFWDRFEDDGNPRYALPHKLKFTGRAFATRESLKLCLDVGTEFSSGNTLLLYISQRCTVAESMFSGDAS